MSRDLIDRQTVIDSLDHVINNGAKNKYFDGHFITAEAMKEYILAQPSAEPETPSNGSITCINPEKTHVRTTDDLISRQDAIIAVRSHRIDINDPKKIVRKSYEDVIRELPSAQPEERTKKRTETRACDLISRIAVYDRVSRIVNFNHLDPEKVWFTPIGVKALIEELPPAQPEQRWIPCSERLPRQGQEVICQCRANMIKVLKLDAYGDWYQDANHCYMGGFVIAWMPLPEPYGGEQNEAN